MGAVWMLGRSELRRHAGSVVLLAGVVALVVAVVLAFAAGARRTSTVVDRFVDATEARDYSVFRSSPQITEDPSLVDAWRADIESVDGVEQTGLLRSALALAESDTDFYLTASPDGSTGYEVDRPLLIDGRMPALDSPDEVLLNVGAVEATGLGVGDSFAIGALSREQAGLLLTGALEFDAVEPVPLELRVVGVGRIGEDLSGALRPTATAIGSPALYAEHADSVGWFSALVSTVTDGTVTSDELIGVATARISPNEDVGVEDARDEWRQNAGDGARVSAFTLWTLAGIALVAGVLAIAQVVVRQIGLSAGATRSTRALGMSARQRAGAASLPAALGVVAGAVVGAPLSILATGAFPVSFARQVEPDPGIRVDPVSVVAGGVILLAVLLAVVALSGARARATPVSRSGSRPSIAARVSTMIERPVPRLGIGMALDGHLGAHGVPVRSALVGAAVAAAGLVGAVVVVSSTTRVIDDPASYGWMWTSKPDVIADDASIGPMLEELVASDDIDAVGDGRCGRFEVQGTPRMACALTPVKGSMQLRVADGRAPDGAAEVALGSEVLDELDVGVGDQVTLTGVDGSDVDVTVVGRAIGPLVFARIPGESVQVAPDLMAELAPPELVGDFWFGFVGLRYAPGVDASVFESQLQQEQPLAFTTASYAAPPSLLAQLDDMRWLFLAGAGFLVVIGMVGLTHFLVVSVRRRRPEFGVVRAMGLRRTEVRRSVSWQAATVTGLGVAIGAPLGVVFGRAAWQFVVADQGLAAEPTSAGWAVLGVVLVSVAGGAALAVGPGWLAARPTPADSLRSE